MAGRLVSLLLMATMVHVGIAPAYAESLERSRAKAERLRRELINMGTGPHAQIELILRDKTQVKGYLAEVTDTYFIMVDPQTQDEVQIAYPQVAKARGHNLSSGVKFAIGAGAIIALLIAIGLASR
ncbi:MAG TPA: hypothetical protein VD837_00400 [Terriglobales bacterium]|nr:hypothetical protein [Terriglobales bacterium]